MKLNICWILVQIFAVVRHTEATADKSTKIIQFLMTNHELCGRPFADAEWIPVLDICEQNCDELTQLCVENDSLVQKCQKLPEECSTKIQSMFVEEDNEWRAIPRVQQRRKFRHSSQ